MLRNYRKAELEFATTLSEISFFWNVAHLMGVFELVVFWFNFLSYNSPRQYGRNRYFSFNVSAPKYNEF